MNAPAPVAVVTGAARGIGLGVARWFLQHGHRVALLDIDEPALRQVAGDLGEPDRVLALDCDVAEPVQVEEAFRAVDRAFGRLDALVNNAGIAIFKPIETTAFEEWRRVLAVNLDGPFLCTQAAVPLMQRHGGGSVVNIASISGLRASTLRVAYGTSKAALIHLTRQQAVELGTQDIRVNAIAPGPVDTEMAKQVHSPAIRKDYHDVIPLGRYGLVEEIAEAVGFLCSGRAGYINGQVLAVDGGFDAAGVGLPTLRASRQRG
jgi:meso-butanediol dehydrogenase / (S,S)-butanediol dehydrogenase / diacetyl reductase